MAFTVMQCTLAVMAFMQCDGRRTSIKNAGDLDQEQESKFQVAATSPCEGRAASEITSTSETCEGMDLGGVSNLIYKNCHLLFGHNADGTYVQCQSGLAWGCRAGLPCTRAQQHDVEDNEPSEQGKIHLADSLPSKWPKMYSMALRRPVFELKEAAERGDADALARYNQELVKIRSQLESEGIRESSKTYRANKEKFGVEGAARIQVARFPNAVRASSPKERVVQACCCSGTCRWVELQWFQTGMRCPTGELCTTKHEFQQAAQDRGFASLPAGAEYLQPNDVSQKTYQSYFPDKFQ